MRRILAIIRPHQLQEVQTAIKDKIQGMTISEVKGFGRQRGQQEIYRGSEYRVEFVPKIEVEIYCRDSEVNEIVRILSDQARTGKIGDGKVFVQKSLDVMRIRTGERGEEQVFHE